MQRQGGRLTDSSIRSLPAPERGKKLHFDEVVRGFAVRCSQGGSKVFVLQFGNDRRTVSIGKVGVLGLAEARTSARRILAEHALGKHRAPRMSVAEALQSYLDAKAHTNRARTMKDTTRILHKHLDHLKAKNLEAISTHALMRLTDDLANTVPGTARHVFCEARTFFRWCVQRRLLQHSPLEGLEPPTPAGCRERVLADEELRVVWRAAEQIEGHYGKIVMLLILSGQRRSEIAGISSEWLDLEKQTCSFPSSITKNRRSHLFPIGEICRNILVSVNTTSYLFPARGSTTKPFNGWSKAKAQFDKVAAIEPWTLHDLRRTYATNLQRLGIRLEVIEGLLNHVSGTRAGIVGVYNRHRYETEMREAVGLHDRWFKETILQVEEW